MKKRIIVIGGGVAGLSSGIYGQMNGFETEIIEMHTITGGQCTAWERKGYRFDYCLHWLVGTSRGVFHDVWKETSVLNNETIVIDHDIHSVIIGESGEEFIIYANIDRWEKYLIEMAPEDTRSIKKMCSDMKKAASFQPLPSVKGLGDAIDYAKGITHMMPFFPLLIKHSKKNCKEYIGGLNFKNQKLADLLSNLFGDHDFSALAFIMMLGWFHQKNAGYIEGGSLPMAKRMEEKFLSLGGKLTTGKRVIKILVENNTATGVVLSDGTTIKGDYVISAADGHSTIFEMLQGKYVTPEIKKAYDTWETFTPLVQVSFGINTKTNSTYPAQSIIAKGKNIGSTKLANGYSIMNYSFDKTMAPQGKSVVVVRFESPWENWIDLKESDYKAEKEKIKADTTAILESHFPGISANIEVADVATPKTTVKYTGVWKGSYEGFLPSSKNITQTLKNTLPSLDGFYMAGQWLFPGGGLPPSVLSGKMAVKQICKKEKKVFKAAP